MAMKYHDGDVIRYGQYYINNNKTKEPLEWIVVDARNEMLFLITKQIIDYMPFDEKNSKIWKESSLRKWLNKDFIREAFSDKEKEAINEVMLQTEIDGTVTETYDHVFILAADNVKEFLEPDHWEKAKPTPYAISKGSEPMETEGFFTQGCLGTASYMHRDGTVQLSGGFGSLAVTYTSLSGEPGGVEDGVRPCMFITMNNAVFNKQLTEAVRQWFFAEQGRIAMVKMVTLMPKRMGAQLSPADELNMTVKKLQKETYLEQIIPRERMDDVDFETIAAMILKS